MIGRQQYASADAAHLFRQVVTRHVALFFDHPQSPPESSVPLYKMTENHGMQQEFYHLGTVIADF